jgi:hypothetical protein
MSELYVGGKDGISIAVTATSAATKVALDGYDTICDDIVVQNIGTSAVYIKSGDATATATQLSVMVPPQWRETFRKGTGATHLACVCAAGQTSTVIVACLPGED